MRKVTTISLDEKTAQIAKQMPNFSHFVRECLLRHHADSLNRDDAGGPSRRGLATDASLESRTALHASSAGLMEDRHRIW